MGAFTKFGGRILSDIAESPPVKNFIISGAKALEKQGPWSKLLADALNGGRDLTERRSGEIVNWADKSMRSLASEAKTPSVFRAVDTGMPSGNSVVDQIAGEFRLMDDALYVQNAKAGVQVAKPITNHAPRLYNRELFEGRNLDKARNHLIKSGSAASTSEADKILRFIRPSYNKYHNLESARTVNLKGYREDFGALVEDLHHKVERSSWAEIFGPKGERLGEILDQIKLNEGESQYKFADFLAKNFLGVAPGESIKPWEKFIYSFEAATKLGTAVIPNAFQPLNALVYGGIKPMAKALGEAMLDYGSFREFGLRSGSIFGNIMTEMRYAFGQEARSVGANVLKYTGFQGVERWNRVLTANAGKHFAQELFEDLVQSGGKDIKAINNLRLLGIDATETLRRNALTEGDLLMAGKRMSDITQFRTSVLDLPVGWRSTPAARIATLYKQFAFNQAKFVKDYVFKPALGIGQPRDLRPLVYMSLIFPTVGEVAADLKHLATRGDLKDRPGWNFWLDRMVENASYVGGFGIMQDLMYALASPSDQPAYSFIGGPVLDDLVKSKRLLPKEGQVSRDYQKAVGKEIVGRIPVAGPRLRREIYPPKQRYKTAFKKGLLTRKFEQAVK